MASGLAVLVPLERIPVGATLIAYSRNVRRSDEGAPTGPPKDVAAVRADGLALFGNLAEMTYAFYAEVDGDSRWLTARPQPPPWSVKRLPRPLRWEDVTASRLAGTPWSWADVVASRRRVS